MNKLGSFKYSAVLLPVLALGMPMAHAGEIGYQGNSPSAAQSTRDAGRQAQSAQERTTTPATPPASQRATQAMANRGSAEYVEMLPAAGFHSASLVGKSVKSHHDDKTIGEVSDLVLDTDGQVVAVVMSVGGIMGIGARDVAIAWDQIERRQIDNETTLWVNLTEQSLKDAPKYTGNPPASRRNR